MKRKSKIIPALFTAMLLAGCGETAAPGQALPEDVPYNHGVDAIMETEDGWYTNYSRLNLLNLHYIDKESGADVYLCSRPECMHDGSDSCTATYNNINVQNTLLYNGALYFTANEQDGETAGIALYKAAADGSALDKVTDICKVKTDKAVETSHMSYNNYQNDYLIIHKGYAYISYELYDQEVGGYAGYIDSGLMKINISTGEKEELVSDDEGYFSPKACRLKACEDYVYFDMNGNKAEQSYTARYNINDGSISIIDIRNEYGNYSYVTGITPESIYVNTANENNCLRIEEYDADTLEYKGFAADTDQRNLAACTLFYDDMIFVCGDDRIDVYKDGERTGGIVYGVDENDYPEGVDLYAFQNGLFKISRGYLYLIDTDFSNQHINDIIRRVSRCPIEDILNGTGKFEPAYISYDERTAEMLWGDIPGWREQRAESEAAENEP